MDYVKAFLVGGLICLAVQAVMDNTKLMPGRIMVGLVVLGGILGFAGVYEPFARWAAAGASVPLGGLGNPVWRGDGGGGGAEGRLGVFRGGLTATAGGICGALVFSFLAALIFQPRMKE